MHIRSMLRSTAAAGALLAGAGLVAVPATSLAADAEAAQTLARQNNCYKCHAIDKKKVGPAWKDYAAKMKGVPDAEAKLYTHLTTGPKLKSDDGSGDSHPIVKAKNPDDVKNLAAWILSL
jgi:cytochrome c